MDTESEDRADGGLAGADRSEREVEVLLRDDMRNNERKHCVSCVVAPRALNHRQSNRLSMNTEYYLIYYQVRKPNVFTGGYKQRAKSSVCWRSIESFSIIHQQRMSKDLNVGIIWDI